MQTEPSRPVRFTFQMRHLTIADAPYRPTLPGGCSISTVNAETRSRFRLITSFYASRETRFLDMASHASKRAPATRNREIEDQGVRKCQVLVNSWQVFQRST
jgi:hypothetical protein